MFEDWFVFMFFGSFVGWVVFWDWLFGKVFPFFNRKWNYRKLRKLYEREVYE